MLTVHRMGVVGTEYADWNDSRTTIKLGQEGGGFQEPCSA